MTYPILAPNSTWFAPINGTIRSSITEINIVDSYTPNGNETDYWDASAAKDSSIMCYVNGTVLTIAGNGSGKIYANADSSYAFSDPAQADYFKNLTKLNNSDLLDTSNATTLSRCFQLCEKLTRLDVGNWDTSSVSDLSGIFNNCRMLTYVDVSRWDTSNVVDMSSVFQVCFAINNINVSKWDVSKVETMVAMFYNCYALTALPVSNWDTSKVKSMDYLVSGCTSLEKLDFSKWNTGASSMAYMFYNMPKLKEITIGANFTFKSSATLPKPNSAQIPGADGNWYTLNATAYTPSDIPSNKAATYYASLDIVRDLDVKLKNGSLIDIADAVRSKANVDEKMSITTIVNTINSIPTGNNFPYKVTIITSGAGDNVNPVICYGENGDNITVLTYVNMMAGLICSWSSTNCSCLYKGNDLSSVGNFALFNNFTGDATITINWTYHNSGQ